MMTESFVVKKKRFSVEQISGILKQAEFGASIAELCRQHGIDLPAFFAPLVSRERHCSGWFVTTAF
jgi:hypothetical protein